jgi:hypothetical protein
MARWRITNLHKKSAVERQFWVKDGTTVVKDEGFRWGIWECDSDEQPDIDLTNPDGYELMSTDYDWEMQEMTDGSWLDWEWPDDVDDEERERVEELWSEEWYEGMEGDGWTNDETEHWIYGPMELTNVDTGETFNGEQS